jgi:hypothetical protein
MTGPIWDKCKRAGCDEHVDRLDSDHPYCTRFCAAVDKDRPLAGTDTADRTLAALLPPVPPPSATEPVLPTDSEVRKGIPVFSGVLNYFPLAIAAVARVSKRGNDKHNPGQPLHWARGKSMDHDDCIARHLIDVATLDPVTGEYEDAQCLAWRALARLQELEERRLGKAPSRGSRVAIPAVAVPVINDTDPPKYNSDPGDPPPSCDPYCGAV